MSLAIKRIRRKGADGGGGGGGGPVAGQSVLSVDHDEQESVLGIVETITAEWVVDFSAIPATVTALATRLSLAALCTNVIFTARFRVRIGGALGVPGGTIVAQVNTSAATFTALSDVGVASTVTFPLPSGINVVQLTSFTTDAGATATYYGAVINFEAVV